jgi:hypothetical protein
MKNRTGGYVNVKLGHFQLLISQSFESLEKNILLHAHEQI